MKRKTKKVRRRELSWKHRLICAVLGIGVFVGLIPLSALAETKVESMNIQRDRDEIITAIGTGDEDALLKALRLGDEALEEQKEEILSLAIKTRMSNFYASGNGRIMGFTLAGEMTEITNFVVGELELLGWTEVETGNDAVRNFIKEEGIFTHVMVSFVAVGKSVSVVAQCS